MKIMCWSELLTTWIDVECDKLSWVVIIDCNAIFAFATTNSFLALSVVALRSQGNNSSWDNRVTQSYISVRMII